MVRKQDFKKKYFPNQKFKKWELPDFHIYTTNTIRQIDRERECVACFVFSFYFHDANLSISPIWSSLFTILSQYVPIVTSSNDAGTKGFCKKP